MKKGIASLLLASALMGMEGLPVESGGKIRKTADRKIPLTNKQKKVRAKNKRANKAKSINRKKK